jgi:hypothetical protein
MTSMTNFKTACTALLICYLFLVQGCSKDDSNPVTEIKSMLAAIEEAAEERSISGVSEYLAANYQDKFHPNSQAVKRSLLGYFHRHRSIYLFSNIKQITLNEAIENRAKATVHVAMTGTQVDSEEALLLLKANVYRFDLELEKQEDQWLVKTSSWRRIKLTEF